MTILVTYLGKVVGENRRLTVGSGRIHRDGEYRQFINSLAMTARAAARCRHFGPEQRLQVLIKAVIHPRMDIDNLIKPCLDALQQAGIIPNDNQVDDVQARRVGVVKSVEASLAITVTEAKENV
jgi:Holliday junction resolvase RusA-like endonuclease